MVKVIGATVPARGKSVLTNVSNHSVTTFAGCEVINRPTSPFTFYLLTSIPSWRDGTFDSLWRFSWYSFSCVVPSAFAMTLVFPNKTLLSSHAFRTSFKYVFRILSTEKTHTYTTRKSATFSFQRTGSKGT